MNKKIQVIDIAVVISTICNNCHDVIYHIFEAKELFDKPVQDEASLKRLINRKIKNKKIHICKVLSS
jgi:hypothetical protein